MVQRDWSALLAQIAFDLRMLKIFLVCIIMVIKIVLYSFILTQVLFGYY
jgi:hypothetical protein